MWDYIMRWTEDDLPEWAAVETDESVEPCCRIQHAFPLAYWIVCNTGLAMSGYLPDDPRPTPEMVRAEFRAGQDYEAAMWLTNQEVEE